MSNNQKDIPNLQEETQNESKNKTQKHSFTERMSKNVLFKHIFSLIKNISEDKLSAFSSEAALFTIISFFPFLMLFFVILSFTSLTPEFIFRLIKDSFPSEIIQLIMTVVVQLNNTSKTVITITIITALWSASRGFIAIEKGFNVVYKVESKKNFLLNRLFGLLYTLGFAVLLVLTLMLLGFGNSIYITIVKHFKFIKDLAILIMGMRAAVLFVLLLFFFIIMYIVLPNRKSHLILELPGAALASLGWVGFSNGFAFYIDNIANFSIIYGSLTTIVLLLLWVYFCMYILFLGAEVNHYLRTYLQNKIKTKGPNSKLAKIKRILFKEKNKNNNIDNLEKTDAIDDINLDV